MAVLATLVSCATQQYAPKVPQEVVVQQGGPLRLGIDVLAADRYELLRGRRVGLITNQTSMTSGGVPTRVAMRRGGVNLVALYAPEHGIDGIVIAGRHFSTIRDSMTGLTVFSLYGDTRKPTPSMLAPIDVLVFDLQDIGCRSYTYISTMLVSMEACAEQGKEFVVLDRPNPLGGWRIEGPPLDPRWKSFVGQMPTPYVHGMTAGELAMMACGEHWVRAPHLHVVKMEGWTRGMVWESTGLPWHRTSPNIPHASSPAYYVATGILGGASGVEIGIGTENPFGYAGASGVNAAAFTESCRRAGFSGVDFTPFQKGGMSGARLRLDSSSQANLTELDVYMLAELNHYTHGATINRMHGDQLSLFNKVYGSDSLRRDLQRGVSPQAIAASWRGYDENFRGRRQRYLLY